MAKKKPARKTAASKKSNAKSKPKAKRKPAATKKGARKRASSRKTTAMTDTAMKMLAGAAAGAVRAIMPPLQKVEAAAKKRAGSSKRTR